VPDDPEIISFIEKVKVQANKFHEIIHGVNTTRMLGNASFRCQRGFPSFRVQFENTDRIFVSRRNVDKRFISKDEFVAVRDLNGMVGYYGPNKPSVDTPVQLRLYKWFPKVNYMLHSHTYIEGAPFTSKRVPCGAIEEASYICGATPGYEMYPDYNAYNMAINILGHGSIVLAKTPEFIDNIKWVPRPVPEVVL
jgi:ribulose-5-phosphate 4-epimerase/fuculose-1-phosphate aldolase